MNFKSLAGQEHITGMLTRTADRRQLPNSYLFAGPEGVGKWATALALTAYLNCRQPVDGDSCGRCPSCRQMQKLQHPNLYIAIPTPPSKKDREEFENYWAILEQKIAEPYSLISGSRQMSIPVATVREMKRSLAQKAPAGGRRVVIIEQMERMLTSSADALLKLVEEPPTQTLIIITASRPEKLLATIVSRCREVNFGHLPETAIGAYLTERAGLAQSAAILLSRLCQGSLGRALYLADADNAQDREVAKLVFKGLATADAATVLAEAAEMLPFRDRFRINRVIAAWQTMVRDVIAIKSGAAGGDVINVDFAADLERLAARDMPLKALLALPAQMSSVIADIELNVETQTAVGALLIDMQRRLGHAET